MMWLPLAEKMVNVVDCLTSVSVSIGFVGSRCFTGLE